MMHWQIVLIPRRTPLIHAMQWMSKISKGAKIRNRYNQVPHLQNIQYKIITKYNLFRFTKNTIHLSRIVQSIFHNLQGCSKPDRHGCSRPGRVGQSGMGHLVNSDRRPSTV